MTSLHLQDGVSLCLHLSSPSRHCMQLPRGVDADGTVQDRQAALALVKRVPASPKARRRSLKASPGTLSHTEPLMAARRAERELKVRLRQLEEDVAAARGAAAEERSRAAALREGVRRAQEARRAAERQRDDAVAAAESSQKAAGGLRARVKALQASVEQV